MNIGSQTFPVAATKIWKACPECIVSSSSESLRRHLKMFLPSSNPIVVSTDGRAYLANYNGNWTIDWFSVMMVSETAYRLTTVLIYVLSCVGMLAFTLTLRLQHVWLVFVISALLGSVFPSPFLPTLFSADFAVLYFVFMSIDCHRYHF